MERQCIFHEISSAWNNVVLFPLLQTSAWLWAIGGDGESSGGWGPTLPPPRALSPWFTPTKRGRPLGLMILKVISNWNDCMDLWFYAQVVTINRTPWLGDKQDTCHGFTLCLTRKFFTKSGTGGLSVFIFGKISLCSKPVLEEYLKANQNAKLLNLEVTVTLLPLSLILGEMPAPWKEKQAAKIMAWSRQTLRHFSDMEKPRNLCVCTFYFLYLIQHWGSGSRSAGSGAETSCTPGQCCIPLEHVKNELKNEPDWEAWRVWRVNRQGSISGEGCPCEGSAQCTSLQLPWETSPALTPLVWGSHRNLPGGEDFPFPFPLLLLMATHGLE